MDPGRAGRFRSLLSATENWRPVILAYFDQPRASGFTGALNGVSNAVRKAGRRRRLCACGPGRYSASSNSPRTKRFGNASVIGSNGVHPVVITNTRRRRRKARPTVGQNMLSIRLKNLANGFRFPIRNKYRPRKAFSIPAARTRANPFPM